MKIVVDIPRNIIENLAKIANAGEEPLGYAERYLLSGTPLPKGGRLIDANVLIKDAAIKFYTTNYFSHITKMIDEAPTVIEADNGADN